MSSKERPYPPLFDGTETPRDPPSLPPSVQKLLGHQLQRDYACLVEQDLPNSFKALLDQLSASDPSHR